MSPSETEQGRALERARFIDRFVAFSVDYFLILIPAYVVLFAGSPALGSGRPPSRWFLLLWLVAWMSTLILYHAFFGSNGRVTLGKRLLGLQVFDVDGYPPSFARSLSRAVAYLLSSSLFGLGFLWALFQSERRGWHDLLAGTMVLETRSKGILERAAIGLAALLFLALNVAITSWPVAARTYYQMQLRANAQIALRALSELELKHKQATGSYTASLDVLARRYGDPTKFLALLSFSLDSRTIRIEATRERFRISARALDEAGTVYEASSPPDG